MVAVLPSGYEPGIVGKAYRGVQVDWGLRVPSMQSGMTPTPEDLSACLSAATEPMVRVHEATDTTKRGHSHYVVGGLLDSEATYG